MGMVFAIDDIRVHKELEIAINVFNVVSVRIWVRVRMWVRVRIRVKIRVRVTLVPMQMLPFMKKSIESF